MADPLSLSGIALGALSLGIQISQTLLQYYAEYKAQSETVRQVTTRLETLATSLRILKDALANRKPSAEETDLVKAIDASLSCEDFITELQEEYEKFQKQDAQGLKGSIVVAGRRLIYPLRQSTLQRLDENIQAIRDNIAFALEVLQSRDYQRLHDDQLDVIRLVEAIHNVQISSEIRQWLNAPDATVNHNLNCAKRYPGTGSWLLRDSQYQSWLAQAGSTLWLVGFAGCGKSVLCSTVIQHVFRKRSLRVAITFFYFTFTEEVKQDASGMLRSLLQQLSGQSSIGATELSNLYERYKPGTPPDMVLISYLQRLVQQFEHVYIVLDALDEAQRRVRPALFEMLLTIHGWTPGNVHLLITSRDENDIRDALQRFAPTAVSLDNTDIDEDIRNFVSGQLKMDERLLRWKDHREEIEKSLTQRAHGVFRWVECQLESIKRCPRIHKRLQQCLATLPQDLDATYERCLSDIDEQSVRDARRLLLVLSNSFHPLTVREMADAIAVELEPHPCFDMDLRCEDADTIREICPTLIQIYTPDVAEDSLDKPQSPSPIVRIAHFSVVEYLHSSRIKTQTAHKYAFDEEQGQTEMAKICLTYLLRKDEPTVEVKQEEWCPLMSYAAKSWYSHYKYAKADDSVLRGLVSRLILDPPLLGRWIAWCNPFIYGQEASRSCRGPPSSLYFACHLGIDYVVKELLDANVNPNTRFDLLSPTPLGAASEEGYPAIVQMLLDAGADVLNRNDTTTALEYAAARGQSAVVRLLLERGARVNETLSSTNSTPLLSALRCQDMESVRMLIDHGAEVQVAGASASRIGRNCDKPTGQELSEIVKVLVAESPESQNRSHNQYYAALQSASEQGQVQVVRDLLDAGININGGHGSHGTALRLASLRGHAELVQMLLDEGADPNITGKRRSGSALKAASEKGHAVIVEMLLEKGANVDGQGNATAKEEVPEFPPPQSDTNELDDMKPALDEMDPQKYYETMGPPAGGFGQLGRLFENLLENMNDLAPNRDDSPLIAAVEHGHLAVVEILLKAGADANDTSGFGQSAVAVARSKRHGDVERILLEYGAQPIATASTDGNQMDGGWLSGFPRMPSLDEMQAGFNNEIDFEKLWADKFPPFSQESNDHDMKGSSTVSQTEEDNIVEPSGS